MSRSYSRKQRRQAIEDDWLAQNHRAPAKPRPAGTYTDAGPAGIGALALGRQAVVGLVQEQCEVRDWRRGFWPSRKFVRSFGGEQGRRYCWYGTSSTPVNVRGYRNPGRYPILPGVPLTFSATVTDIWPTGTIIISKAYIRLDQQPEETRRAYADEFEIRLDKLGLEDEQ